MASADTSAADGPELVVGFVTPIGTRDQDLVEVFAELLQDYGYRSEQIQVSKLIETLPDLPNTSPLAREDLRFRDRRIAELQRYGNAFCAAVAREDALTALVILQIKALRKRVSGNASLPAPRTAYLIRSLKRQGEVDVLRQIYGDHFVLVAGHSSTKDRLSNVADQINISRHGHNGTDAIAPQKLLDSDEHDRERFGQRVRDVFVKADVIVQASSRDNTKKSLERFCEMLFETSIHTPLKDESGMFAAWSQSLSSSSLSRQVGAVICDDDGEIVSAGTNEVAKADGGPYRADGPTDGRDHLRPYDDSEARKRWLAADLLLRFEELVGADGEFPELSSRLQEIRDQVLGGPNQVLEGTMVSSLIEYQRAVHAEMHAMLSAARRGVPIKGLTLYCTTFPCHECSKAIVAAGIRRVVYLEPYAKSLTAELFNDSISLDGEEKNKVAFSRLVGIAPRRYTELFSRAKQYRRLSLTELPKAVRLPRITAADNGLVSAAAKSSREDLYVSEIMAKVATLGIEISTPPGVLAPTTSYGATSTTIIDTEAR